MEEKGWIQPQGKGAKFYWILLTTIVAYTSFEAKTNMTQLPIHSIVLSCSYQVFVKPYKSKTKTSI